MTYSDDMTIDNPNPIGEKYADLTDEFLAEHIGETVTPELIGTLRDLILAHTCELVGTAESAEILEVTRQRVSALVHSDDMPAKVAQFATGPIWLRADVEQFARTRNRKPGRPRKQA